MKIDQKGKNQVHCKLIITTIATSQCSDQESDQISPNNTKWTHDQKVFHTCKMHKNTNIQLSDNIYHTIHFMAIIIFFYTSINVWTVQCDYSSDTLIIEQTFPHPST